MGSMPISGNVFAVFSAICYIHDVEDASQNVVFIHGVTLHSMEVVPKIAEKSPRELLSCDKMRCAQFDGFSDRECCLFYNLSLCKLLGG